MPPPPPPKPQPIICTSYALFSCLPTVSCLLLLLVCFRNRVGITRRGGRHYRCGGRRFWIGFGEPSSRGGSGGGRAAEAAGGEDGEEEGRGGEQQYNAVCSCWCRSSVEQCNASSWGRSSVNSFVRSVLHVRACMHACWYDQARRTPFRVRAHTLALITIIVIIIIV